jgi:ribonuclease BN (tRNA processing enzyme)
MKAKVTFMDLCAGSYTIEGVSVDILAINHPCRTIACRFTEQGKSVVYMTDNELGQNNNAETAYAKIVSYCNNADILIHDAMYTEEELAKRKGWGHSSYHDAVQLGIDANVKTMVLFHHDPEHADTRIAAIVKECKSRIKKSRAKIKCLPAREGLTLTV